MKEVASRPPISKRWSQVKTALAIIGILVALIAPLLLIAYLVLMRAVAGYFVPYG
jgi:hypothetical protein